MNRLQFTKEKDSWVLDTDNRLYRTRCGRRPVLPDTPAFFEWMGNHRTSVTLLLHTEPFTAAYQLQLIRMGGPRKGGGYYNLFDGAGRVCRPKLWLCELPLLVFGDIPHAMYVKLCPGLTL